MQVDFFFVLKKGGSIGLCIETMHVQSFLEKETQIDWQDPRISPHIFTLEVCLVAQINSEIPISTEIYENLGVW
jgi:hypothetical protein